METGTRTTPAMATAGTTATDSLVIAVVGSGGDGVALLGDLILRMAAQQGLYGMMVQSYGPQIRGGESAVALRIAREEVQYEGDHTDLLLCFRLNDLKRFRGSVRLHPRSLVMLEQADQGELPEWLGRVEREPLRHPFASFQDGMEVAGDPKNMLGLGLIARALGWPLELVKQTLEQKFGKRPEALARNLAAVEKAYARTDVPALPRLQGHGVALPVEAGNEATARGAIAAGLRFFAGYPITPSSEVMETLIDELPEAGGTVVQAEDEIAALGMVIGASFGGTPSMTATSGPGLSLMTEMMGLSSMVEIPTVIVDCQRVGPATGMPSRTEQADLNHAVYAGHGDFPRVVLGVYDVVHAHDVMFHAFQVAETWALPVLVLSDAYVAQRRQIRDPHGPAPATVRRPTWTADYGPARFKLHDIVSPFRRPGTPGGQYLAAGIEHTATGAPSADGGVHEEMQAKRFKKMPAIAAATRDWYRTFGADSATRGLVAWGSMYGLLREYVKHHPEYRVFMPEVLHPFPLEGFEAWRKGLASCAVVELSFGAQFHRYLCGITDMNGVRSLARSGGLPMSELELTRLLSEATR
jgi:2-oxoglutarate/2-oxoacid ferredoxin oxidoreductase subunit alpha